jgi:hypothetical protein
MSWSGGRDGNVIVVVAHGHNGKKRDGKKRGHRPIKAKLKKERTNRGVSNETRWERAVTTTRKTATPARRPITNNIYRQLGA